MSEEVIEEKSEKAKKIKIAAPTGIPEIDAVLGKLSKDFGEDMSGEDYGDVKFCTSGSTRLDAALGRGGIPTGRIIEIFGPSGSLKTSLGLTFIAARQAWRKANGITNKRDVILDLEHQLETSRIVQADIDMSQIIWKRLETAEEALEFLKQLLASGAIDYVLVDSVDAMESEAQKRKQAGESIVGGISKIMSESMRALAKLVPKTEATVIFINQLKINPMQMFGSPKVTPGGSALGYYARLRLEMMQRKDGIEGLPGAALMRIKVIKNGFGPPIEDAIELAYQYGKGFDSVYDVEQMAKELDILKYSAGQTKVQWTANAEPEPLLPDIDKGKEAGQRALREHPELVERLRHACLRASGVETALPDSYFKDKTNVTTT